MDLSRVIKGPVVTEKAERQKAIKTYTLKVDPRATKIDVKRALKRFYDIDVASVRTLRTAPKTRKLSAASAMQKRHREKRMIITLDAKSKTLDLASFKNS